MIKRKALIACERDDYIRRLIARKVQLMNLILLAIGGWAVAMVFVLAVLSMASNEDRAARDEQTAVTVRLDKQR